MRTTRITAAAAGAVAALVFLSGCTGRADTSPVTSEPVDSSKLVSSLPAATGAVDEVTWALVEGEPTTLDPAGDYSLAIPNLCENLLTISPDFTVEPGVATSADWVDPVTFVIDLRDDVTFWDGTSLTADDVAFSLERNRVETSAWFPAFVLVDTIEVTGDLQVTVHFTAPDSTFRDAIAGAAGAVLSKAFVEQAGDAFGTSTGGVMCTGPYVFDEWTPGTEIVTSANPDYWGGAPLVGTLTYTFITDGATLANALLAGEVDGAFNVPPASRDNFAGSDSGRLVLGPSTASYSFGPTNSTGAGADPRIRQALSLAIDREQFITTVLHGLGEPQSTFTPPFAWSGMEAADQYTEAYDALAAPELDLEQAKQLVEESGVDTSKPLVVAIPAGAKELSQTAAIIQAAGAQIGLTIEIDERQPTDFSQIFFDPAARESIDFVATVGYLDAPGVLGYAQQFLLPAELGGFFNWSGYSNDEVTADLQTARTTLDPAASADAFIAAQEIFAPDQLQVTLASAYQTTFLQNGLTGVTTSVAVYSSPWALHLGSE
ncbi:ABC transporter substrate-binding protein [Agromyces sp. Leaf222]|uniref:ABC transporter substrate-binding protein n=1 Tax=Agromyces sp. Leaf222 TaxID=1735688 RepID=UPI0006FC098B|nr:ABC transporter substrate-binding protein [Agromyces sp. Leaf222]KQM82537.1 ABC transporter substrate-binding protein [Agromyces sp. Leaf222]